MSKMCIVGYFVESLEPTAEEKKDFIESLKNYHIERYPDGTVETTWIGTQEEYDDIIRYGGHIDPGAIYIILDN